MNKQNEGNQGGFFSFFLEAQREGAFMDVVAEPALHFCRAVELVLVGVWGEKTE